MSTTPVIQREAHAAAASGQPASLYIPKRILWDGFFAERLEVLNERSVTLANDLLASITKGKRSQANDNEWKLDYKPKPTNFAFKVGGESPTFVFNGEVHEGNHLEGWTEDTQGKVTTSIKWTPDSEKATIAVSITVNQTNWTRGSSGGDYSSPDAIETITGAVGWSVELSLATSNHDADLTVQFTDDPVTLTAKYDTSADSFNWTGTRERNQAEAESAMRSDLQANFEEILNELERAFSGPSRFALPGGGKFVFKNPTFNKTGDLLVELRYVSKGIV